MAKRTETEVVNGASEKIRSRLGGSAGVTAEALAFVVTQLAVRSKPPSNGFAVTNLYVNAEGKLVIEYDDGG